MKCPYCGSEHIKEGIRWGMTAKAGDVGLEYMTGFLGIVGTAPVFSDLCLECGTVLRTYILDDTDKDWVDSERI